MDFPTVSKYMKDAYGVFVNTDFFTVGDEGETYGGIRLFEFAKYAGVRHFIWSNLDYGSKVCLTFASISICVLTDLYRKEAGKRNMRATTMMLRDGLAITSSRKRIISKIRSRRCGLC